MKIFAVLSKKDIKDYFKDVIYVEEEFSLTAALFSGIWSLYHRMWKVSTIIFIVSCLVYLLFDNNKINQDLMAPLLFAFSLYIGSNANDWYTKSLLARGYEFKGVIAAKNLEEAQLKFITEEEERKLLTV